MFYNSNPVLNANVISRTANRFGCVRDAFRAGIVVIVCAVLQSFAYGIDWQPITPEDRAATASQIDPNAGAEILYHLKQVDDSAYHDPRTDEYIRIKVYNEKGVKQLDKRDIFYDDNDERIDEIAARVIKPDGTIINVDKKAFYDRDVIKNNDTKVRVRSFSFPSLKPGDIAEYKWSKSADSNIFALRFKFLDDMPTRYVIFRLKSIPLDRPWTTNAYSFLCVNQNLKQARDDFYYIELKNQPAFIQEPYMPAENDVQPWMLFYPKKGNETFEEYWKEYGSDERSKVEKYAKKPSELVRSTAASVIGNATSVEDKLARINDYCRSTILNISIYTPQGNFNEKLRKKDMRSPDDLIKTKMGNSQDIPILFIALARSLGIDARLALCSDKNDGVFNVQLPLRGYLSDRLVAVKTGNTWSFYDPAHCVVSTGSMYARNQGVPALIVMPKGIEWVITPRTPAAKSCTKRKAELRLNDEGDLLGEIREEYFASEEVSVRARFYLKTPAKIEEMVRDDIKERLPNAEVTDVLLHNISDVVKPLVLTYSIRVPNYAEQVGRRFFVQPNFFEKGREARFTAQTRTHDICFSYGSSTDDSITIKLPADFKLEEGSAPDTLKKAEWGEYDAGISLKKSTNTIMYYRKFRFEPWTIKSENYKLVKGIYDYVHTQDDHSLTFRTEE